MVSIALLVACEKNAVIEKFNESIKQAPDARSHAKKILPVETIHQYDWAQQVPLFKNEQLVGVKVLRKNIVNNQLSYLIIHYNTGAFADVVLHKIQYEGKVGQSKPISIKSNNLSKNRIALLPLTAGSNNKDLDNGRNGTGKRSLVSPGGTLPMVTITGIYNNGSITAVTPTTYFLINGAFVNGGGGSSGGTTGGEGGTNPFDPYIYLDYLDPLYVPDAGSSGLPSEFNLNEYDYMDGTLYSRYDYPGINDGYEWKWWRQAINKEPETNTNLNTSDLDGWWNGDSSFQQSEAPTQPRPNFSNVNNQYPKTSDKNDDMPPGQLASLIGGQVLSEFNNGSFQNACAIRLSYALNHSGISIPEIPGKTWKGSDGKNYFREAAQLKAWLTQTFGEPDVVLSSDTQTPLQMRQSLLGFHNRGIYLMLPKDRAAFQASGHATLWGGLNAIGGKNYLGYAGKVFLWRLPQ